jgi:O-antigen/teichoic acid export membrane protein
MSLKAQAVKNVSATWLGLLVHAVVGFFLSPFILHRLGDDAFSLWILVFALTGYYGLLDLGIRSSIVKYTATFVELHDEEQLSRFLSTSLAFYVFVALVVLVATTAGFFYLRLLFRIPVEQLTSARILFLLSGTGVALTFPLTVFAGALEGLQKFAWLQLSQIGLSLIRAALIVVVLLNGGGLLAIGTITVAMNLLSYAIFTWMALKALPVRLSMRHIERCALRKMANYGVFAFAILVAEKLRFQSDVVVIGASLSSSAIATFSIGARLVEYAGYAVKSMSQIFTPMSSQFHAAGDLDRLRRTFAAGNRACAFIIFPVCTTLVILGKSIIESWVGIRYVSSYSILVLLIVPRTLYLAQSTSIRMLLGMGRHRVLASVLLLEGSLNLLLSLLLVRHFGIVGVALGTAIPLACTSLFFLPQHLCRVLQVSLGRFLTRVYRLPLVLCIPLAGVLCAVSHEFPAHRYGELLFQIACGGVVYCAGLGGVILMRGIGRPRSWRTFAQVLEPK